MSSEQMVVDEHEQMIEVHVTWCSSEDGIKRESESERPICRCCWHEGPDGRPRHADWPCEVVALRADLAAAREREARYRETLAAVWQRPVGDAGWYCLRCGWGNEHAPACILATPPPPEPQVAISEPTPAAHHVITARTQDGWASRCPCGWTHEGTSPASVQQAGELHQAGWSTTPAAGSTPSGEASSDA